MTLPQSEADLTAVATATPVRAGLVRRLLRNPVAVACLVILAVITLASVFAPLLTSQDPARSSLTETLAPAGGKHLLGGDGVGRDVLARLLYGGRTSLLGALIAVSVALVIGVPAGLVAGYYRRWFDAVGSWLANLLMAVPAIVVLLVVMSAIGQNTYVGMAVFGVLLSPGVFRLIRASVISVREELYVDAARVSGLTDGRIVRRHILPVVQAPTIIQAAQMLGLAIVIQSGLEFLGLGSASEASWGSMLNDAFANIYTKPILLLWPGAALALTVAAFCLLGNALRDALDASANTTRRSRRTTRKRKPTAARTVAQETPGTDTDSDSDSDSGTGTGTGTGSGTETRAGSEAASPTDSAPETGTNPQATSTPTPGPNNGPRSGTDTATAGSEPHTGPDSTPQPDAGPDARTISTADAGTKSVADTGPDAEQQPRTDSRPDAGTATGTGTETGSMAGARPGSRTATDALLVLDGLTVSYPAAGGEKTVVDGVSLTVRRGEVLGLVGESGSGKSQTAFAVLGLLPPEAQVSTGRLVFEGTDLARLGRAEMNRLRGRRIAYVPQEPMSNLDPSFRIGSQLVEPVRRHLGLSRAAAKAKTLGLLERVGIADPERVFASYPHQISGGMAQRVLIAGAVSCDPDLLIADEPTTALDVTVQAEVLDLMRSLQRERNMGMVLVTHDFGVVADICDRVSVMQTGAVVESAPASELFAAPQHPYTRMLLASTLEDAEPRPAPGRTPATTTAGSTNTAHQEGRA
ncbi:dipeptide/oligopeptide/nickel ABC transporter permease/ATP-binding protein [Streptomyces geranii]|uniref:dipeptide/oligopeptide/nickel ABC transporter permease/ATP-binding protein n=1 Tax=Streptomyces geranii TaxID=2058923 RepID=UPI001E3A3167|nr:dipeptide/oligopeptide/nickel ABC transporter permease/ATP-binding protein [Streptomyces geranii]